MQKALTMLTLVLVCIAATSVTYYYVKYLPRVRDAELAEQRRKANIEMAQRCSADGRKFYSDFLKAHPSLMPGWDKGWDEPEMHFSNKLNTCILHIRSVETLRGLAGPGDVRTSFNTPSIQTNQVIDTYSNRIVLYGWFERKPEVGEKLIDTGDPKVPNYTSERYFAEKDKLFSE